MRPHLMSPFLTHPAVRFGLLLLLCAVPLAGCGGGAKDSSDIGPCEPGGAGSGLGCTYPAPPPLVGHAAGTWQGTLTPDLVPPPQGSPALGAVRITLAADGTLTGTVQDAATGETGTLTGTLQNYTGEQVFNSTIPSAGGPGLLAFKAMSYALMLFVGEDAHNHLTGYLGYTADPATYTGWQFNFDLPKQ